MVIATIVICLYLIIGLAALYVYMKLMSVRQTAWRNVKKHTKEIDTELKVGVVVMWPFLVSILLKSFRRKSLPRQGR